MLTVLALLLVGVGLGQLRGLPDGAGPVLDAVVIRVSLPALVLARVARLDRRTTATLLVVVPRSNSSFLGFPAVEALLGADHLPAAVVAMVTLPLWAWWLG